MLLWIRTPKKEKDSWSIVYNELVATLQKYDYLTVYTGEDPPHSQSYKEFWWGEPSEFKWETTNEHNRVAMVLSETQSFHPARKRLAIENLKGVKTLICPSRTSSLCYREAPLDSEIHIVPLGVSDRFAYQERDFFERPFRYLMLGVTQLRKGSWLGVESFYKVFKNNDSSTLTIATGGILHGSGMFNKLREEYVRSKNIIFMEERVPNILDLYKSHHVLIHPHLAEGFGLCVLEAMATGMPSIVSRCSSPREFFHKDFGWWIEMSDEYTPIIDPTGVTPGFWRIPDRSSLSNAMVSAYENPELCQIKGRSAYNFSQKFKWSATANKIVSILKGNG